MTQPRMTVLVVDDEPLNRAVVRGYLGRVHDIVEAGNAEEAFAAVAGGGIDLVLLDVMMPGTDGFEVCARLKATSDAFLPVLLLTALSDQEQRNRGLEVGADDFISKPVDRGELSLRVAAFLRTRTQDQTIRAQMLALRDLGALKDDLVSLMVHDLRNPLAGVHGFLQILVHEVQPDLRDDVVLTLEGTTRIKELLDDILQVRQLEAGRVELVRERLSAALVVDEGLQSLAGMARAKGVVLGLDGDGFVNGDRKLLRRALENIVMNALKYSPAGQTVDVHIAIRDDLVDIEVRDRGPGIPDAARQSLFAKFGGSTGTADARRGFGLGLYLVRLTATAHGGSVSAMAREGGGTVVRLSLPALAS